MGAGETKRHPPRVLVLGAYGLIGATIVRHLISDGCAVTGLGRNSDAAARVLPGVPFVRRDLADLCSEAAWADVIDRTDVVVNCAGALQEGPDDRLEIVHHDAIRALAAACKAAGVGLVQISAVGAQPDASTAFMTTKARGDQAVREAGIRHWILRPGLVLAPTAYGGTTMLRILAAMPYVQPFAYPDAPIQTVSVDDVAEAVSRAVRGEVPSGTDCDLVEATPHTLRAVVGAFRGWLGFAPARRQVELPSITARLIGSAADLLGRLGWRSPLRTTAMQVMSEGVTGDPTQWRSVTGHNLKPMSETLAHMPATIEDRLFARMALAMPVIIGTLFVFWLVSGLVGIWQVEAAARVLEDVGWPPGLARASVLFWAVVDIAIAGALLVRRYAARACLAMIAVSLIYLVSATITVPHLWADPLGPLIKILPAIVLAAIARAMLENR